MTNFVYTEAKYQIGRGTLDLLTDDIRVMLLMTTTTADTEEDLKTLAAFYTLDEYDGSNYSSGGAALTSVTYTTDSGNDLCTMDAADTVFPTLGAGSTSCSSILVYKFIANTSSSMPVAHIDNFTSWNGNTGTVSIIWSTSGIIRVT